MSLRAAHVTIPLALAASVCSAQTEPAEGGEAFFPLMGWFGAPAPDLADLRGQVECGMTIATFVPPSSLDACAEVGLRAILTEPRIRHDWTDANATELEAGLRACAREYRDHPALWGWCIRDEPNAADFGNLARTVAILREEAPGKVPYINLLPNYASPEQLGTATYEEHLTRYCDEVKPAFVSYDNYFGMLGEGFRPEYFTNLEAARSVSLEKGLPFWNIILSTPHYSYREPTEWEMQLQVFTTLAYGGRGLAYFTYATPQLDNYHRGPIDPFGARTPMWDYVRRCNLQVRALAPILLKLRSTGVFYAPEVPDASCRTLPGDTLVRAIEGGRFLVGEFLHEDGSRWFLVVNLDSERSVRFSATVDGASVSSVNPYTGVLEGLNTWLLPGQGKLCRVD